MIFILKSRVVEFLSCAQRCGREEHWFVQDLVVDPIDNHLQPLFTPTGKRFLVQAAAAALWQAIKKTLAGERRVWVMGKSTFRQK
ncbi:possible Gamma-thionins family [Prochlorococcus marinus str. MIT 9313]|uniref:Possible Gamma-thionins family n=1 Tax=Prochlorococcus marinus (strain MIT 9313) TaxID=74547 RepID=Q7TUX4_PROMM|nr:possible Gamma-thionins family [Prochlorococcus marinus str. MIT 9313]